MTEHLDIVDIHTHLWPADRGAGGARRVNFGLGDDILRQIVDPAALLDAFAAAGVSLAVVSTTVESLFGVEGPTDESTIAGVNDWLAGLVAAHPGRLAALGVVDPFSGEAAAREAERALGTLGLAGLVIDSSRHGRFLADPAVRPTLEVANRYRAPVFVHPINAPQADLLIAGAGKAGNSLGRGLMNGVAFLSLLESDILDAFPDINFVFATLGLGAIVQASRGGRYGREARDAGERPNIYFDTMGDDPAIVRILTSFFGVERVLAGTDWPILPALAQASLRDNLIRAGLDAHERQLVAGLNARRILGSRVPGQTGAA
ncbi:putative TIM-barrel fold metal-dependent hydrolase [Pseudochelatococcus lubricantis]|uniref:TIM-barrel fold metal-dependent hydrolase n=1 Tax=Pseudochelatococcus lubricantis TaxID=1538102 RepID=A0ABX0V1E1_9HYPH|nr:amidohydrolase family protein [Pseudochelatococcus lubricantis]NIJ58957.1 putative TIM-barrel fold metal-dependent hydrolase [Pseudochelatococcus lubricantis]